MRDKGWILRNGEGKTMEGTGNVIESQGYAKNTQSPSTIQRFVETYGRGRSDTKVMAPCGYHHWLALVSGRIPGYYERC